MTIFLYGPDGYRLKQSLNQIVSGYKKKYPDSLNLFYLDLLDKEQKSRLENSLKTVSFFEETKLIILKNSFISKEISGWLKNLLAEHGINKSKSIIVALIEGTSQNDLEKINKKLFKELISSSKIVRNFEYLKGIKLENWIRSEFTALNCFIDSLAIRLLINLSGNESWGLANEIQKLFNFSEQRFLTVSQSGQKRMINSKDVAQLISGRADLNIFEFVDAVVSKKKAKSYELLFQEIKNGRDPYYLLTMIVYGFRNILMIKDLFDKKNSADTIAKKAGLHSFTVRKALINVSKHSQEELKKIFGQLLEIDTSTKNGKVNLVDSLFEFVVA